MRTGYHWLPRQLKILCSEDNSTCLLCHCKPIALDKARSCAAKSQVLLDCGLLNCNTLYSHTGETKVAEELAAYIFKSSEDGSNTLLRNVSIGLQDCTGVINQKITIFWIVTSCIVLQAKLKLQRNLPTSSKVLKTEASRCSETSVMAYKTVRVP
jgi:hypothetical protein